MIKGEELQRHLKLIRGMADVLNMLADEVEARGKMDDTDLGTLSKVGAKLMYVSVAMPFIAPAPEKEKYTPIELLNLSPRTLNALINGGVGSIEQLEKARHEVHNFRGMGAKGIQEINDKMSMWVDGKVVTKEKRLPKVPKESNINNLDLPYKLKRVLRHEGIRTISDIVHNQGKVYGILSDMKINPERMKEALHKHAERYNP